jgi:hypothetical protein
VAGVPFNPSGFRRFPAIRVPKFLPEVRYELGADGVGVREAVAAQEAEKVRSVNVGTLRKVWRRRVSLCGHATATV